MTAPKASINSFLGIHGTRWRIPPTRTGRVNPDGPQMKIIVAKSPIFDTICGVLGGAPPFPAPLKKIQPGRPNGGQIAQRKVCRATIKGNRCESERDSRHSQPDARYSHHAVVNVSHAIAKAAALVNAAALFYRVISESG